MVHLVDGLTGEYIADGEGFKFRVSGGTRGLKALSLVGF